MRAGAPAASVLLPVRDGEAFLEECLESIAAQTRADYELVVVDDGSRDRSVEIVAVHAERDARIRLVTARGSGLVAALETGLAAARAPIVARIDADDRMHPDRLRLQLERFDRDPELDLVASRVRAFPAGAVGAGTREYLRWQNRCLEPAAIADERYVESPFTHPSVTFRRDVVVAAGGYRDGPFPEDYDLWLRLAHAGRRMSKVDACLVEWRQRADSVSRTDPRYAREAFDRLRVEYLARDPRLRSERPLAYWGAGRRTRARARGLVARGFAPAVWIDVDPRKIGNRVEGVEVVDPEWLRAAHRGAARPFVLGYVASHGAREEIGTRLEADGYRRGRDYLMVG